MTTAFIIYPGVVALDLFGAFDTFAMADELLRREGRPAHFRPTLAAESLQPVQLASGPRVCPDVLWDNLAPDRVAVPGCFLEGSAEARADVAAALRTMKPERAMSVCTGAFILAEAGLLDGRRATTHWQRTQQLAEMYPQIDVAGDALYVRDGGVWTSAGVTAGIDLAIALIREELGAQLALAVARELVVFAHRPGHQSQFSAHLAAQATADDRIYRVQQWVLSHLRSDLSVEALAGQAAMSHRNFARRFTAESGMTPGTFVQRARLDAARGLLETTDEGLCEIAEWCGLGSEEVLRRLFQRHLGTSPGAYRRRFGAPTKS